MKGGRLMEKKDIYVVASYTDTVPGKLITARAKLKFWNRYDGDTYSHVSLSRDTKLNQMVSLARKELHNPFNSGLIHEDIRKDIFAINPQRSKIAVMKLGTTEEQFQKISDIIDSYWQRREEIHFNYAGLITLLLTGNIGYARENSFFCSQWVTTVLRQAGYPLFPGKKPQQIRPFDIYIALKKYLIYEGLTVDYPEYYDEKPKVKTL